MWFEILPSAAIIFIAFNIPGLLMPWGHKFFLNNKYRRNIRYQFNRITYLRDRRLNNNPYIFSGLECIPDEEDKPAGNEENM